MRHWIVILCKGGVQPPREIYFLKADIRGQIHSVTESAGVRLPNQSLAISPKLGDCSTLD